MNTIQKLKLIKKSRLIPELVLSYGAFMTRQNLWNKIRINSPLNTDQILTLNSAIKQYISENPEKKDKIIGLLNEVEWSLE